VLEPELTGIHYSCCYFLLLVVFLNFWRHCALSTTYWQLSLVGCVWYQYLENVNTLLVFLKQSLVSRITHWMHILDYIVIVRVAWDMVQKNGDVCSLSVCQCVYVCRCVCMFVCTERSMMSVASAPESCRRHRYALIMIVRTSHHAVSVQFNMRFVGHRYMQHPGAPYNDERGHAWVIVWMY